MEVLQLPNSPTSTFSRKGCNPVMATQRSKVQSKRSSINRQLYKQMRLRNGAENLFNATTNPKIKETVALELSFVNSNLQLLKEELSDINSTVEPYQNKSGKAMSIPMLPLGLKDTTDLEFMDIFETILTEHYNEEPRNFSDELADFADMRTSVRTPSRSQEGVDLLLEYYNQLYFIENRFFSPTNPPNIFFHWYDCITGVPSVMRSVALEKASILFNVGSLYSQIATRADRTRKKDIQQATDVFQRAAGVFNYLRTNYGNPPNPDLSPSFLSALTELMLAQAQECELERKILGGFEIQLGKCVLIAQEAMKWLKVRLHVHELRQRGIHALFRAFANCQIKNEMVAEKYFEAVKVFMVDDLAGYVPQAWISMAQVKHHHYHALAHYYAGLGLIEQHELAEPVEIAQLLSTLYLDDNAADVPKPDDAAKRKEDRRRLGKSHLRHAVYCHEQALQTHKLCPSTKTVDVLKDYLQHAHERSVAKFAEIDSEYDFFDLIETPSIQGYTDSNVQVIPPEFDRVSSTDIFKRLGPLSVFSAHYRLSSPRDVKLTNQNDDLGFTIHGDSPVFISNLDESTKLLGLQSNDIIISVDDVDVKWRNHGYVSGLISSCRGTPVTLKVVAIVGPINGSPETTTSPNGLVTSVDSTEQMKISNQDFSGTSRPAIARQQSYTKHYDSKKGNSFNIFNSLKRRPKANLNRTSTFSRNSGFLAAGPHSGAATLQRSSPRKNNYFLGPSATLLRKKKHISSRSTDF